MLAALAALATRYLSNLPPEDPFETIQDHAFKDAVVLLPEHEIMSPSEKQQGLVRDRKRLMGGLLKKLDWRLTSTDYRNTLVWWWHSVVQVGRAREYGSMVKIQKHVRRWCLRHLLTEMSAVRDDQLEWVKWWKVHRGFP